MTLDEVKERIKKLGRRMCKLTDEDIPVLYKYASALKAGDVYLEIGTAAGCSAAVVALSSEPGVRIVTIDIGPKHPENIIRGQPALEWYEKRAWGNWMIVGVDDRIEFIIQDANLVEWDEPINLLFIDGAHDFPAVKKDFLKWSEFIVSGGSIIFHDYHYGGIEYCVHNVAIPRGWQIIETGGLMCVLKKLSPA